MDTSYKFRKQAFVSNLTGGSISEITAVTLVAPVGDTIIRQGGLCLSRLTYISSFSPGLNPFVVGAAVSSLLLHSLQRTGTCC